MKKIVLLLMLVIVPAIVFCAEPKIEFDKIDSDGSRMIGCNEFPINKFTDRFKTWISLSSIQIDDDITHYISIKINSSNPLTIKYDSSILFRLINDDIIHLKAENKYISNIDFISNIKIYTVNSLYPINEEDIKKIATTGIKKIRIETNIENIDKEIKEKKGIEVAEFLGGQYSLIQEALETKENDIMDGF